MDIDELIKAVTLEILSKMSRRILLFITGGAVNIKEVFSVLKENTLIKYSAVMTDAAVEVIPRIYIEDSGIKLINEKPEMTKEIDRADAVVIPVLTRNTLSKISAGISDNLVTLGISETLMMNKKVIAVKDSFDPENPVNIALGYSKNPNYNKMLLNHCRNLEDLGVEFVNSSQLREKINNAFQLSNEIRHTPKIINHGNKTYSKLLTLQDILGTAKGEEIILERGTIISPLAKDYIESSRIKIRYI